MPMQFVIPIAIKPYLKKYLAKTLEVDAFEISRANPYGNYLLNCLRPPTMKVLGKNTYQIDVKVHSEIMRATLGEKYWKQRGHVITYLEQYYFNKFVDQIFRDEMYKYIWMRVGKRGSLNQAINTFCAHYGITEDDLALKTIQKWQERRARLESA